MILNCLQTVLKTNSWWKGVGKQLCSGQQSAFVFMLRLVSKSLHSVLCIFCKLCSTGLKAKDICYLGRTFIMKIQIQNTNLSHFTASYLASHVISRHHWILVHKIIGRPLLNIQSYVNSQVFSKYKHNQTHCCFCSLRMSTGPRHHPPPQLRRRQRAGVCLSPVRRPHTHHLHHPALALPTRRHPTPHRFTLTKRSLWTKWQRVSFWRINWFFLMIWSSTSTIYRWVQKNLFVFKLL